MIDRAIFDEIQRLYATGLGAPAIAQRIGNIGQSTIWRILHRSGIAVRQRGSKGVRCVDCGQATQGARRCPLHVRMRNAEMNLEYKRRRGLA
jgi:hypothetical protein